MQNALHTEDLPFARTKLDIVEQLRKEYEGDATAQVVQNFLNISLPASKLSSHNRLNPDATIDAEPPQPDNPEPREPSA